MTYDKVGKGIAFAVCALLLASGSAVAQAPKIELKYSVVYPPVGAQAEGAARLGKFLDEYSGGRLEMKFYPSSQLGDKMAALEGLRAGKMEMSECAATDLSNFDKLWSVFSLPFTFNDGEHAIRAVSNPAVAKILNESAEAAGFKIIAWWNMGERSVLNSKRPVRSPADLKGVKIRVMQDPVLARAIGAMGAIGTPMAWGDVYTAVQQKVIDGLENSPPVITANKLQEVAKYYSLTQQFIIPDPQLISKKVFDGLPPDLQAAVVKAGKASQEHFSQLWAKAVEKEYATLKASGVQINEVDKAAFRAAVKPMVDDFLKSGDDKLRALYAAIRAVE
jgi:tripartite ATP-independent transporter DctP family solute receptor